MVYEFTDLQGHVGKLLAGFDGENPAVCSAIEEHYLPHGAEEEYPQTSEGFALAFIDRLDSLQRCFELGLQPKGSSDPLGLRRAANGMVRLLLSANVSLSFSSFLDGALLDFVLARMKSYFSRCLWWRHCSRCVCYGFRLSSILERSNDCHATTQSIKNFSEMRATFKRVMGLTKEHTDTDISAASWVHTSETSLASAYVKAHDTVTKQLSNQEYASALVSLATLKPDIDTLFDSVMVMDDDPTVRHNRLSLLRAIADDFRHFADFTILST